MRRREKEKGKRAKALQCPQNCGTSGIVQEVATLFVLG
jgi:hypothetical protein